jgi:hypothetical protein
LEALLARRPALFVALTLVTVTLLAVHPTWARSIGADVWNVPALEEQIRASKSAGEQLEAEDTDVRNRILIKEAIVTDLIAGRISLAEAAEQFTVLNADHPRYTEVIRAQFPGVPDHEMMARHVIAYALPRAAAHERSAVAKRLDAELHQMLAASAGH